MCVPLPFFCRRLSSSLDSASTTKVMKNSAKPQINQRCLVQTFTRSLQTRWPAPR